MRRVSVALVAGAVGIGIAAEWSSYLPDEPAQAAGDFAVGLAFVLGGALTLERSRKPAMLMAATGFAWFAGGLVSGLVFLHRGPLVHLLLSYPRGRLESRFERVVLVCAYAAALVHPLGRSNVVTLALLAAVLLAAVMRYARAGGAERRARAAALAATAAVVAAAGTAAVLRLADSAADGTMLWAYEGVLTFVAAGLCADLLWGRWTEAAVRGLVIDLGDLEREATLRTRLARSVGDPTLQLGYWDPARATYVDEAGESLQLPGALSGRLLLAVDDDRGRPAAAIVHDPAVLDEPGLRKAVTAAVRIAVANVELQSQVRQKVDEVRASRRRLVEAADLERLRLEAELHDATEPRLRAIADDLWALGPGAGELADQLEGARDELRELGRGLHPRALTEAGLAAALTELGERFPFSVEVVADGEALPSAVAAAAYFLCSEGLANAAKHAGASRVRLAAARSGATLVVAVEDDGVGGADLARGSGLRGLADRVDALGGELRLQSPPGGGTRVEASLPVPAAEGTPVPAGMPADVPAGGRHPPRRARRHVRSGLGARGGWPSGLVVRRRVAGRRSTRADRRTGARGGRRRRLVAQTGRRLRAPARARGHRLVRAGVEQPGGGGKLDLHGRAGARRGVPAAAGPRRAQLSHRTPRLACRGSRRGGGLPHLRGADRSAARASLRPCGRGLRRVPREPAPGDRRRGPRR